MAVPTAPLVVGIRFQEIGKVYHFDASAYPDIKPGDYVVVETARGRQLGQVTGIVPPDKADLPRLKPIKRPASARDLMMRKLYTTKEAEALVICREIAAKLGGVAGVKFIRAEYNYDGSVLTFLYTSEEAADVSRLRRRLAREFRSSRVEMRRVGARDAAKLLGEYGACSSARCCATHLTEFSPVSIRMAKEQGISLNPSEITGMCGRLRCCLVYEFEQYVEARKELPKLNRMVSTPYGEGKVVELNPLKGTVTVLIEDVRHEVSREELEPPAELHALQQKAARPCPREGQSGICECGAHAQAGISPELPEVMAELPVEEHEELTVDQPVENRNREKPVRTERRHKRRRAHSRGPRG